MMNYRLLVAEDESIERMVLCKILRKHFGDLVTVLEARDGEEAMEIIAAEMPQIAILDIEMPGKSGLEVARRLREDRNPCAVLFLTGFDNFSYAKQAIEVHALDYILKPYEDNELIFAVEEAIQIFERHAKARKIWQELSSVEAGQNLKENEEAARMIAIREDIRIFIENNYMKELSMQDVAKALRYADTYFCKLFKQCFRVNFSTYLNQYRIEKAKERISSTRDSVKDISAACGYTDPNYFGRVFKQIVGMTPSEYRLQIVGRSLKG